jgi:hypothetical protein
MGSKTDQYENDSLAWLLTAVAITGLPVATSGNFYVALFTVTPSDTGGGTETVYTNYARVAILRNASAWTISGTSPTQAVNTAQLSFPACGATGATVVAWALMSASSGGTMYYWGALSASLVISNGITPQIAASAMSISED